MTAVISRLQLGQQKTALKFKSEDFKCSQVNVTSDDSLSSITLKTPTFSFFVLSLPLSENTDNTSLQHTKNWSKIKTIAASTFIHFAAKNIVSYNNIFYMNSWKLKSCVSSHLLSHCDPAKLPGPFHWSPSPLMLSLPWEAQKLEPNVTHPFQSTSSVPTNLHFSCIFSKHLNVLVADDFLLLSASSFKQLHQLIQINAAFTLVQLCSPTFELICGWTKRSNLPNLH